MDGIRNKEYITLLWKSFLKFNEIGDSRINLFSS